MWTGSEEDKTGERGFYSMSRHRRPLGGIWEGE